MTAAYCVKNREADLAYRDRPFAVAIQPTLPPEFAPMGGLEILWFKDKADAEHAARLLDSTLQAIEVLTRG